MEKVEAFKTTDGALFCEEVKANKHQHILDSNKLMKEAFLKVKDELDEEMTFYTLPGQTNDIECESSPTGYHIYWWESTEYDRNTVCVCCVVDLYHQPWN